MEELKHGARKTHGIELEERYAQVEEWCALMHRRVDIVKTGMEAWGVCERTMDSYLAEVKRRRLAYYQREAEERRASFVATQELIVRKSLEVQDYGTASKAHCELAKFHGDYAPPRDADREERMRREAEAKERQQSDPGQDLVGALTALPVAEQRRLLEALRQSVEGEEPLADGE